MNRLYVVSAFVAASLAFVTTPAISQQKSVKDQLVGSWSLASWECTNPDGTKWQGFGSNPKGVNHFTADGRFFVIYARGDLSKLKLNDRAKVTPVGSPIFKTMHWH